ncbi:MAG: hypothetical protein GX446_12915 [Chthonomonadales bacterium]|nr:hypothetical protein [Chthonomonadales bacterium]
MRMRLAFLAALTAAMMVMFGASGAQSPAQDPLARGFANPPASAKPWVYWFWLNGNITREGITLDLEAMKRVGIGGVLIMEVDQGAPLGPVPFASEKWRELFRHVVSEAARLGLEVNMNNDAGWCGSGGPWVKPEHAMQRVVWATAEVEGPRQFSEKLPQPPAVWDHYRDIAVFAFPAPGPFRIPDIAPRSAHVRGDIMPDAKSPEAPADSVVPRGKIVDLTGSMQPDGTLTWTVPEGRWTILRMGHTPTGAMNAPSPESGRGPEVDKLSKEALDAYWDGFVGKLVADNGPLVGKTFVATHIDSWETGSQNWTPRFREEFMRLRGYDPLPYLPVYAGYVVDGSDVADRFLYDVRQTVSDLLLSNYAGHMRELAHRNGMRLTIEAYGDTTVDNLAYAGRCDEPMGEFWSWSPFGAGNTLIEMAGAAHVYGKRIVGAEAFTAHDGERWLAHPGYIKAMGDWAFALGINRFVFHRYALQPWRDRRPGMSMGPWGLHYERTQTWWEQSGPWHRYLARCQYLLQQGLPVADVLCLAPEGAARTYNPPPDLNRKGYKADGCPAEALLTRVDVRNGRLVLPDGMSYRALVLPGNEAMTPTVLRKVKQLADAGAIVIGAKPKRSPSLAGYPGCDAEVARIADALWSSGKVLSGKATDAILRERGILPDFVSDRPLNWTHRRIGNAEVYFVANGMSHRVNADCRFRVTGRVPELWDAVSGATQNAVAFVEAGGMTRLMLPLEGGESVFVVFRKSSKGFDPVVRLSQGSKVLWPVPKAAVQLKILKALWGPAGDDRRTKDVTDQVQRMVDRVGPSFTVAELASEGDPALMVVKTLRVEYESGGQKFSASATDPEVINFALPSDATIPVRIVRSVDGRWQAVGSRQGTYTATLRSGKSLRFRVGAIPRPEPITASWEVAFPKGWGAPDRIMLDCLVSLHEHPDEGVRHFSGTATYTTRFPWTAAPAGTRVYLDLGDVQVMAHVKLNGKDLGLLWRAPYRVDVTRAVKAGKNTLEIAVTNLWINRMIGDEYLPEDSKRHANGTLVEWPDWLDKPGPSPTGRYTFTSWRLWSKQGPLQPSGLIGPVRLVGEPVMAIP